jgi:hypothetical protein
MLTKSWVYFYGLKKTGLKILFLFVVFFKIDLKKYMFN